MFYGIDEIVIGKGPHVCMSTKVWDIPDDEEYDSYILSQNALFYDASLDTLGVSMKIYKDTRVGQKLTSMINAGTTNRKVEDYLTGVALKRIKAKDIFALIENIKDEAFKKGKEAKADEICDVLGLSRRW